MVFSVVFSFVNWVWSGSWSRNRLIFSNFCQNQLVLCSSIYMVFSVVFSFVNWVWSGSWSRNRLIFSNFCQNQLVLCSSIYMVFSVVFSFVNWVWSGSWSWNRLIFSNFCQNQRVLCSSIYMVFSVLFSFLNWIKSGSWSRNRLIFSKRLSEPACSSQFFFNGGILSTSMTQTNVRNATSLGTFCFKDYHYALYILPHSCAFHPFCSFSSCILPCGILFSYPGWCCWSAKGNRFFSVLLPFLPFVMRFTKLNNPPSQIIFTLC